MDVRSGVEMTHFKSEAFFTDIYRTHPIYYQDIKICYCDEATLFNSGKNLIELSVVTTTFQLPPTSSIELT
jgi:hypothetical protein